MKQNTIKDYCMKNRHMLEKSFGTMFVKGLYMLIQLLAMPSYLLFLGDNRLSGVWLTLTSFINWIVCFDLGIGNGLRTEIVLLIKKDDVKCTKEYISTSYFVILCIVILLIFCGGAAIFYLPVNQLFNISKSIVSESCFKISLFVVLCGMALQLLCNLVSSILYAFQKAVLPGLLNLLSAIIVLFYVKMPFHYSSDRRFLHLCIVYAVSINLPSAIATFIFFLNKWKKYRPSFFSVKKSLFPSVIRLSGKFFVLQIIWIVISKSNEFLILKLSAADAVVEYQIYYKIFSLVSTFAVVAMTPVWSAVSKAVTENNFVWIHKTYHVLILASVMGTFLELLIMLPLQWLVKVWLGQEAIIINQQIAFLFAINNAILIFHAANTNIANGMVNLKVQLYFYPIAAVLNIVFAIIMVGLLGHWIGVVISNIITLMPCEFIQWIDNKKNIQGRLLANTGGRK